MSRQITPALDALLQRVVTEPVFLITLDYGGGTVYNWSTRGTVTVDTTTYESGIASVLDYKNARQGTPAELTIRIPASAQSIVDTFFNEDWRKVSVIVDFTYNGAFDPADLVRIVDGRINGVRIDKEDLAVYAISQTSLSSRSPRVVCRPPLMNCLPPDGTQLTWGGTTITINRR